MTERLDMERATVARHRWPVALLVLFGTFLMSAGWALSMPLAAGTDEPQHIVKAASVVRGQLLGEPTAEPAVTLVEVPAALSVAGLWGCFAGHPKVGGDCVAEVTQAEGLGQATTSAGMYYPGYYIMVGWPSLLTNDPTLAVWGMRLLTGLVSALLLTGVFVVLSSFMSRSIALAIVGLVAVPQAFFLSAIVNPNAWEIFGALGFMAGLFWFGLSADPRERGSTLAAVLLAVGGLLAANARGVSPFWLFLLGLVFLTATRKARIVELLRVPKFLVALGVAVIGAAVSSAWTLYTGTLSRMGDFAGSEMSPFAAFAKTVMANLSDPGLIGFFGWLDTPAPYPVYFIYGGAIIGVILLATVTAARRWRLVFGAAAGVYLVGPALLQALAIKNSGYIWQGRYTLVVLATLLLVGGFSVVFSGRSWKFAEGVSSRGVRGYIGGMLVLFGLAQVMSFMADLARYAVPNTRAIEATLLSPRWAPLGFGTIGVTVVFLLGIAAIAVATFIVLRSERRSSLSEMFRGPVVVTA